MNESRVVAAFLVEAELGTTVGIHALERRWRLSSDNTMYCRL